MAPLPDNATNRFYLDYTAGNVKHTLIMRYREQVSDTVAATKVADFLNAIKSILYTVNVLGARKSSIGTNVSFPVAWTGLASYGVSAQPASATPNFVSFVGRDSDGIRTRVFMYGVSILPDSNYRSTVGENAAVDGALAVIRATAGLFVTAAGKDAVWNNYGNIGVSAYWQRKRRRAV